MIATPMGREHRHTRGCDFVMGEQTDCHSHVQTPVCEKAIKEFMFEERFRPELVFGRCRAAFLLALCEFK